MKKAGERMKPRIFIGSSKESVKIAEKVKSLLDGEYVCQLWCDNFFDLGQCTYHELLKKSLSFDYAIFIGGKDDYVRRESTNMPLVIMFIWSLGYMREFLHMRDVFS